MFTLNRSIPALARGILFGLICFAIVLWFLFAIPITKSTSRLVDSEPNEEDVIDDVGVIDEAISDCVGDGVGDDVDDGVGRDDGSDSGEENELDLSYENLNNDTMVFACVILRHGNCSIRLPGVPLTNDGMLQVFKSGQFFRRRYDKLLGDYGYANDKIYVLSTNTDRAIMSAETHLTGMFPPTDEDRWNNQIFWHPIPIHTLPHQMDIYFRGGRPCPKYTERYNYYMEESPQAKFVWRKYRQLIRTWQINSRRQLDTIEDVADFHRYLLYKMEMNPLNGWEEEAMLPGGPMDYISNVVTKLRGTPELVRRRAGFLIKEILEFSDLKINGNLYPDRLFYLYSAHSSTILPILNGFGIYERDLPPYASSLHFEVYKNAQDEHYFQFFYRKPGEEHPLPLDIPGCGEKWTLQQFYSTHGNLIPRDFRSECEL